MSASRHLLVINGTVSGFFGLESVWRLSRCSSHLRNDVNDDWTSDLLPQNLHGFTGPVGLVLLWLVVRHGRKTAELIEQNESFTVERTKHGRASDMMMALVMIHRSLAHLHIPSHLMLILEINITIVPHLHPSLKIGFNSRRLDTTTTCISMATSMLVKFRC